MKLIEEIIEFIETRLDENQKRVDFGTVKDAEDAIIEKYVLKDVLEFIEAKMTNMRK